MSVCAMACGDDGSGASTGSGTGGPLQSGIDDAQVDVGSGGELDGGTGPSTEAGGPSVGSQGSTSGSMTGSGFCRNHRSHPCPFQSPLSDCRCFGIRVWWVESGAIGQQSTEDLRCRTVPVLRLRREVFVDEVGQCGREFRMKFPQARERFHRPAERSIQQ